MSIATAKAPAPPSLYADLIVDAIRPRVAALRDEFQTPDRVQSCHIDNLLPEDLALEIFEAFPHPSSMMERKTLREHKFIAAQMNQHNPILEKIVYAFQDRRILDLVEEITGIKEMIPDDRLYAGGISLMGQGHFLNPHLDNSHDNNRKHYRVINILYYVSPNWSSECGGNLELWDNGPRGAAREIVSKFNRLVIMATHRKSWHSVNRVRTNEAPRCCVSNYYFSAKPLEDSHYFHVTTFRGRPEQFLRNVALSADSGLRSAIRKVFKNGIVKTKHIYDRDKK